MNARAKLVGALLSISTVGSLAVAVPQQVAAVVEDAPPIVVISEIMYHPVDDPDDGEGPDIDNFEFVEVHNPGDEPVSLAGLVWLSGVDGTLPDVTVDPGGYVIVSPDIAAAESAYDVTPIGNYEKKLSNGGETLTLGLSDGTVVDEVTYSDDEPWPGAPDGKGPSLELIDPTAPGRDAEHWQASAPGGSPGTGPIVVVKAIGDLSMEPSVVPPDGAVTIETTITGFAEAELLYRVGFEAEQRMAMDSDGTSFSASIPGQESGALVRYRIETGPDGPSSPEQLAGYRYHGFVVSSPAPDTQVPRMQFFVDEPDFEEMHDENGSLFDRDRLFDAIFAFDGVVYDGTKIQVRGGDYGRTHWPKQSYNVELPDGRLFDAPVFFDYPVDEFAVQAEWIDWTKGRADTSWYLFEQQGFAPVPSQFAYLERNGSFFGVFRIAEKLDGVWRDAHGWGEGNFYKASGGWNAEDGFDQKEGSEDDPILDVVVDIATGPIVGRNARLYDTFDVPNMINYTAITLLIDHNDQNFHNFYVGHDAAGTGRVSLQPWDLDWTWRKGILTCTGFDLTEPGCIEDPVLDAFWNIPEFRAAVYRRLRSIMDTTAAPGVLESRYRDLIESVGDDAWDLEYATWFGRDPRTQLDGFDSSLDHRRDLFNGLGTVPASQSDDVAVVISEIHPNPADDGPEILELANLTTTSVDLSGWRIDGVDLDVPFGTVIPPLGRIVFTDDDRAFREMYPGLGVIVVEYPGGLKKGGEQLTVMDDRERTVDTVTYATDGLWPAAPLEGVYSMELTDLDLESDDPASWAASTVVGGTPGRHTDNLVTKVPINEIVLRAKGSTGTERVEIRSGTTLVATFTLSTQFALYTTDAPSDLLNNLKVRFINDASTSSGDRNVYVDYLEVGGQQVQADGPGIPSVGHYSGGSCGLGFKQSQKLHCNGYFDFSDQFDLPDMPDVPVIEPPANEPPANEPPANEPPANEPPANEPPASDGSTIIVDAAGEAGDERIELFVDGESVASMRLTADPNFNRSSVDYEQLVYEHPTKLDKPEIRIAFTNDSRNGLVDRNVRVDAVTLDGVRFEAEDPTVVGTGVWHNGARCKSGTWTSEFLHCNGSLTFTTGSPVMPPITPPTTPPTDPPTGGDQKTITVFAAGQAGGELIKLLVNDEVVATKTLSAASNFKRSSVTYEELTFSFTGDFISGLEVAFTNDSRSDGKDLNVRIDAVVVDSNRIESEDSHGTGVWQNGGRCQPGLWESEFLHCNGRFRYIE